MKYPALPKDENLRLQALLYYNILDSMPEQAFDDLTLLASRICDTPVALISLVDDRRQWFKSRRGLDVSETPKEISFCAHAILDSSTFVINDSLKDERFAMNPLATGAPHVRFYAGAPLTTPQGQRLGTLCVIDHEPRRMEPDQIAALEALARQVIVLLELRHRVQSTEASAQVITAKFEENDAFFQLAEDLLCVAGTDGYFKKVSSSFMSTLGYTEHELLSRPYIDFVHPDDLKATAAEADRLSTGRSTFNFSNRYRSKAGQYLSFSWKTTVNDGKIYAVARDNTGQLEMDRALIRAKTRAESAAQTKSQFLANMSHEIRTPMNGIIGMANLMIGSTTNPEQTEQLRIIQNCGNSLLELIDNVLDFSKLEADKVELEDRSFSLSAMSNEILQLLSTKASQKGLELSFELEPKAQDWIMGDETRIRQILTNLIGNAIKFTETGSVRVKAQTHASDSGLQLQIEVADTGPGLNPEDKKKLFRSFSQQDASTTRRFGGSGLGLAISKGLCEKMGGRIWVESVVGRGSSFYFEIPVKAATPETTKKPNVLENISASMAIEYPLNILVAEDNDVNQKVANGFLSRLGYKIDVAKDGVEVLKLVAEKQYDIIFMDCHMPNMDGFEATRRIHALYSPEQRPKIVALSASALKEDIDHCMAAGMTGFMSKPIRVATLVEELRNVK